MSENKKIIVFDTETTGFSPTKNEIVQLSYILYDTQSQSVLYATKPGDDIVNINGKIPKQTTDVHGITKDMTLNKRPIKDHIDEFIYYCNQANQFVGHNVSFDIKMIIGQINKIIQSYPEEEERYKEFLNKFQLIGNNLPDAAYCTMEESKSICAEIIGTNRIRKRKLMEVHQLLFNQDVGGKLHNALVDIAVTLRVFLKLTLNIDICKTMSDFNTNVANVTNNYDICSLVNPINSNQQVKQIEYTGDLITSLSTLNTNDGFEEEKVMVQSVVKKMAKKIVSDVQKQAMNNYLNKISPENLNLCTSISICRTILKSGNRKGQQCGRPVTDNEFCGYHTPKTNKIQPNPTILDSELNINYEPTIKNKPLQESRYNGITNLFSGTKKNTVVPLGGKRKKNKSVKRKRIIKRKSRIHNKY